MIYRLLKSPRGQTSVEYLLLIVVAISFGLTFMKKMDQWIINNPNGFISAPLNGFKNQLKQDQRYQRFPLRR